MPGNTFTDLAGNEEPDLDFEDEFDEEDKKGDKGDDKDDKDAKNADKDDDPDDFDDDDGDEIIDEDDGDGKGEGKGADKDDDDDGAERYRQELAESEARNQELIAQAAASEARNVRTTLEAHQQSLKNEKQSVQTMAAGLEEKAESLKQSIIKASEDEDHAAKVEAEDNLSKVRNAINDITGMVGDIDRSSKKVEKEIKELPEPSAAPPPAPDVRPITQRWIDINPWFRKKGNEAESVSVTAIDGVLVSEGYDPGTDRYYAELTKRMKSKFQGLEVKNLDGSPPPRRRRRGSGKGRGGPANPGSAGTNAGKRGRPKLDAEGRSHMEDFGMDPKNKDHVKHYLRTKAQSARREKEKANE